MTAPGEECQFDWSDVSHWTREWGLGEVQCFSAILCWSRCADLVVRPLDRPGAHLRGPGARSSSPSAVCPRWSAPTGWGRSGQSQGRRFTLHPPAAEFAQFHGTEIRACQARDAKRKGKVERPFRDVKERFLEECRATGRAEEHGRAQRAGRALARGARPSAAAPRHGCGPRRTPRRRSARCWRALPRTRFDTAYVEARRVHVAIPQIEWRGVHYSVPPACLGQRVEVRQEVDEAAIEIRWAGETVARHRIPGDESLEV